MQAPRIPSFFKAASSKSFTFVPRYYDEGKERREGLKKGGKTKIKFTSYQLENKATARRTTIIFLIIILSLLAYKIIIN